MKLLAKLALSSLVITSAAFSDTTQTVVQPRSQASVAVPIPSTGAESTQNTVSPTTPTTQTQSNFTPDQVTALQKIIHDYLVNNPQVLIEASKVLQEQQEKKMEDAAMTAIDQNKVKLFGDANSPSIGSKTAPVIVVEFFDYQCGHCHQMGPVVEQLLNQDKNILFIFKELPIFGAQSTYAAKAALAAAMQSDSKYFKFHNLLLTNKSYSEADVIATARKAGLNIARLKRDINSPEIDQQIRDNFSLAKAMNIPGTPVFVIANQAQTKFEYIPGAATLAELQAEIKAVQ
ncbi:MAG: hypothetical protein A3F12_00375 [Gammaproteobacteria bacterium RIFCSPHIGHO2_12_FULL_38_14]|nr:MAG: hypothetical protein A3F12_00375 [Gammaproteobacteria bacterium RIFCSPHIGHO2_12_FULL_38_14]